VEKLESTLLDLVKELHSLRADLQKRSNEETLEDLLEAEDVARILGVEIAYVYSQARAHKIPSVKIGKYRKFSPTALKKWLDRKNGA
jgi:excisionase family DNA binding protein